MELVGEAATGYEAIAAVERLQPDIVVMDIRMPALEMGSLRLGRFAPSIPMLKLSACQSMRVITTPMRWNELGQ